MTAPAAGTNCLGDGAAFSHQPAQQHPPAAGRDQGRQSETGFELREGDVEVPGDELVG